MLIIFAASIGSTTGTRRSQSTFGSTFDDTPPTTDDHWHWAYGIYVCDSFLPPLTDDGPDISGIHTHKDGVIHIHPFDPYSAGEYADIGLFFETVGAGASANSITVRDSRTGAPRTIKDCGGKPAKVKATIWDIDADGSPSRTVVAPVTDIRFDKNRQAITIALVTDETAPLPKPPSVPTLDQLTDVPGGGPSSTTTTRRSGTTATRRPGTTTTRPPTTTIPVPAPSN